MVSKNRQQTAPPLPPGKLGLPFIGETLKFGLDPDFLKKKHEKYGSLFKTKFIGIDAPIIAAQGADLVNFIVSNEDKYFETYVSQNMRDLLGKGALTIQTGAMHKSRRKILHQAFQPRTLQSYLSKMADVTNIYLSQWEKAENLNVCYELHRYTFDIACKLLIGLDDVSSTALLPNFMVWISGLSVPVRIPGNKLDKAIKSRGVLLDGIDKIITQRRQQGVSKSNDMLSILLSAKDDDGLSLSDVEIQEQVLAVLFAGHSTLSSSLTSFFILLDQHKDIKEKCRQEIKDQHLDSRPLADNLNRAVYLGQVFDEILRLNPPVSLGFKKILSDCDYGGYRLPKGWNIMYSIDLNHQDPEKYSAPESFDPTRFAKGCEATLRKEGAYLPFGGGIRECLGKEFANLEMKIFAIKLLNHYDWELTSKEAVKLNKQPILHPKDHSLPIRLKKRQKSRS